MKASEFITELQKLIEAHGDLEVKVPYEASLDEAGVSYDKEGPRRFGENVFVIDFLLTN